MPFTATASDGYTTSTATWIAGNVGTSTLGGHTHSSGISWGTSDSLTATTTGTAYYNTDSNDLRVFNGDISGSTGGWVSCSGSTITLGGDMIDGDTVRVSYMSDGTLMSNPYIYIDSAEQKEARIKRQLKEIMRSNLMIKMGNTRQNVLRAKVSPQEIKARQTLRDLITEKQWRGYLTNGFVMIPSLSGKFYQVFNDQRHIKVYSKGKLTDEICIHTDASECPPSDHILNMMMLIQNDEQIIWTKGIGNVYNKDGSSRGNPGAIYDGAGLVADAQGVILNGDVADGEVMRQFIAGGCDVPVTYVGSPGKDPSLSLVETYRRLKVA